MGSSVCRGAANASENISIDTTAHPNSIHRVNRNEAWSTPGSAQTKEKLFTKTHHLNGTPVSKPSISISSPVIGPTNCETATLGSSTDILNGIWELMSVTTHERPLICAVWQTVSKKNKNYSQNVHEAFLKKNPRLQSLLFAMSEGQVVSPMTPKSEAEKHCPLADFFDHIIYELKLDNDFVISYCQEVGRSHARRFLTAQRYSQNNFVTLNEASWDSMEHFMVHEVHRTLKQRYSQKEIELHFLVWKHFCGALVSIVRETFEMDQVVETDSIESISIKSLK